MIYMNLQQATKSFNTMSRIAGVEVEYTVPDGLVSSTGLSAGIAGAVAELESQLLAFTLSAQAIRAKFHANMPNKGQQ